MNPDGAMGGGCKDGGFHRQLEVARKPPPPGCLRHRCAAMLPYCCCCHHGVILIDAAVHVAMHAAPKFATVSCMLAWSLANRKVCCFPSYLGFMMPSFCANGCDEVLVMLI